MFFNKKNFLLRQKINYKGKKMRNPQNKTEQKREKLVQNRKEKENLEEWPKKNPDNSLPLDTKDN